MFHYTFVSAALPKSVVNTYKRLLCSETQMHLMRICCAHAFTCECNRYGIAWKIMYSQRTQRFYLDVRARETNCLAVQGGLFKSDTPLRSAKWREFAHNSCWIRRSARCVVGRSLASSARWKITGCRTLPMDKEIKLNWVNYGLVGAHSRNALCKASNKVIKRLVRQMQISCRGDSSLVCREIVSILLNANCNATDCAN